MESLKSSNEIKVSVIIVTYNCAEVIEDSLRSCLANDGIEIIIVDNASTDNTKGIILSHVNDRMVLIANDINTGFTHACNQGIRKAHGKYIMLLNPDASLKPGVLLYLSRFLDNKPGVGAVAPCLFYPDGRFQNYTRRFPTICGLWVESFIPRNLWRYFSCYRKYTYNDADFTRPLEVEQPAGAALMLRNKWLLDESYFIYVSDVDLCKTIINDGYRIMQVPEAKVVHHQSRGGTENLHLRLFLDLDNYYGMYHFFKKFHQPVVAFFYRIVFGASLLLRSILTLFELKHSFNYNWNKFIFFLQKKNFRAFYEQ